MEKTVMVELGIRMQTRSLTNMVLADFNVDNPGSNQGIKKE